MKKSVSRWGLTQMIGSVISTFLVLYFVLMIVSKAVNSNSVESWQHYLMQQGMILIILLAASTLWSYWMAGKVMVKFYSPSCGIEGEDGPSTVGGNTANVSEPEAAGAQSRTDMMSVLLRQLAERHRHTLQELKSANSFLNSLVEHSSDSIYVLDLEGRVQKLNPAFEELYGYRMVDVAGQYLPIVTDELRGEPLELIQQVCEGRQVNGYETIRKTKEGHEIHVSLTVSPIRDERGDIVAVACISRNITERKATEVLLRKSEKLSVVGQLAAGVAHEIRNPLTTLRGFVQILQLRKQGNPLHLELMLEELDRINLIVSEFIVLSKPHLNQFVVKELSVILSDLSRLLESQANLNNIILVTDIDEELPRVRCEENQLKQVFLNVIKNGMEAMPGGGVVSIEARCLGPDKVLVRITDQGTGIPEELLPRLGEPFISSKDNAPGLGLMVSQQILANHKGQMSISSKLGIGTTVDILLPVVVERSYNDKLYLSKKAELAG